MANEQARQLLQQGIAAARAGQQEQARQLLQETVRRDPRNESAWLWLSSVAKDDQERIFCLKQLLSINPNNENAINGLRQLGVPLGAGGPTTQTRIQTLPQTSQTFAAPPPVTSTQSVQSSQPGVPVPDSARLDTTFAQLDGILQRYQPVPTKPLPFEWMKKKRGRVGDSSAAILRAGVIGAVLLVVAGLLGGGYLLLREPLRQLAIIPTATPFATDRPTATATLGLTDTPSPTPRASYTPTSVPPSNLQRGDLLNRPPTPIYPNAAGGVVRDSLILAAAGKYDEALEKLDKERQGLSTVKGEDFDAVVYHMAQLYLVQGNADRALVLLNDNRSDSAIHHAALANVYFAQSDYEQALSEATLAFNRDADLAPAAIIAARVHALRGNYTDAIRAINRALENPRNANNVRLWTTRGTIQLQSGNLNAAQDDARLALYVDPADDGAFVLRSQALLAIASRVTDRAERIQAYGTAVLSVKEFMLYFPGETVTWLLLGKAREGEENLTAALDAYTQAVVVDQKSPAAQQVFIARGQLYLGQRRYQAAFDDFEKALLIGSLLEAHAGRFQAALALKNYAGAIDDIDAMLKDDPANARWLLAKTDLLIRTEKFTEAGAILTDAFVNALSGEDKATAVLYRGIVNFQAQVYDKALADLNESLAQRESGIGHYYRGQIFEALRRPEDAISDYQWLVFWNGVYKYDFISDVNTRLEKLLLAFPTSTPIPSPTGTPTLTPTRTETPSRTPTFTRTPTITRTPRFSPTPEPDTETPTESPTETPTEAPTETPTAESTAESTAASTAAATEQSSP